MISPQIRAFCKQRAADCGHFLPMIPNLDDIAIGYPSATRPPHPLRIANCELRITNCRLQIADCRLQIPPPTRNALLVILSEARRAESKNLGGWGPRLSIAPAQILRLASLAQDDNIWYASLSRQPNGRNERACHPEESKVQSRKLKVHPAARSVKARLMGVPLLTLSGCLALGF